MPQLAKVYLDYYKDGKQQTARRIVEVEILEDRGTSLLVKLPDGNVITRKKSRDLVNENS